MIRKSILALGLFALSSVSFAGTRFIIKGLKGPKGQAAVERAGGQFLHSLHYSEAMVANLSQQAIQNLERKFPFIEVEEDIVVSINKKPTNPGPGNGGSSEDPSPPPQEVPWGISHIKALEAHDLNRGAGVTVCIVDTGIDKDHPDLMDNIVGGENFVVKKGRVVSNDWDDDNDHGSHVAGTVAAVDNNVGVIGVAPEASLFGVKVLDRRGSGYTSAVADGVRSCIANNTHIISMSLGSSQPSTLLHDAIKDAVASGLIVVAAAGNDGGPVGYPAAFPEVVAVSATDSNNNLAYFSNRGPEVNYAAPGVNVLSTTKGGTYKSFNGTSMATPHVSGVFALHLSALSSGVQADDIGLSFEQQGSGLVNALRTVQE